MLFPDAKNYTALTLAAETRNYEAMMALRRRGADTSEFQRLNMGLIWTYPFPTMASLAQQTGYEGTVRGVASFFQHTLQQFAAMKGIDMAKTDMEDVKEQLVGAVCADQVDRVRELFHCYGRALVNPRVHVPGDGEWPIASLAALFDRLDVLRVFHEENGAPLEDALPGAVEGGRAHIVRWIFDLALARGGAVEARRIATTQESRRMVPLLHRAARVGSAAIARLLIDVGGVSVSEEKDSLDAVKNLVVVNTPKMRRFLEEDWESKLRLLNVPEGKRPESPYVNFDPAATLDVILTVATQGGHKWSAPESKLLELEL